MTRFFFFLLISFSLFSCGGDKTDTLYYRHGTVKELETDLPIQGIKITCFSSDGTGDSTPIATQDPVFTDENGRFEVLEGGVAGNICDKISLEDIDGVDNGGEYETSQEIFEDEKLYYLSIKTGNSQQ